MVNHLSDAWLSGALVGALVTVMLALVLMWAGEVNAAVSNRDPFEDRVTHDEDEK